MNDNFNGTARLLLQKIMERLETSPIEFVEALIDLLTAPERKRDHELLKDLLIQVWFFFKYPENFASLFLPRINTDILLNDALLTPYDRLIQVVRIIIETEIFRYLVTGHQHQITQLDNKVIPHFWGGLTLHIKLSLPLEPHSGPRLFSKGFVKTSDGKTFFCEPPLSEGRIFELLARLGPTFVMEYASSYFQHNELRAMTLQLANESIQLLVQERTLNRYVNKFSKQLAAQVHERCTHLAENPHGCILNLLSAPSLDSVHAQLIVEASSILSIQTILVTSPAPLSLGGTAGQKTESANYIPDGSNKRVVSGIGYEKSKHDCEASIASLPTGHAQLTIPRKLLTERLWEDIRQIQKKKIRDEFHTIYIPQNLEYTDLQSDIRQHVTMEELIVTPHRCLILTAAPDGGKTRLQQELILRARTSPTQHIGINLNNFAHSRFHSFHQFAALEILKMLNQPYGAIIQLSEELLMLDLEQKICWHFDGWDDSPESERAAISMTIASVSQFTLSTSSPNSAIKYLRDNGVDAHEIITIRPFTLKQILEFINFNFSSKEMRTQRRALQLPGLARLPGGLGYICNFPEVETIVEILLGYINHNLEGVGEPAINPDELVFSELKEFQWQSESFAAAYLVVKARASLGLMRKELSVIMPNEILPYMGATSREQNELLATHGIEHGVRTRLWQRTHENQSVQFIVPEIGLLLVAVASFATIDSQRWLDYALGKFQQDPSHPLYQMMMTLAMWHQEKLLMRAPA